MGLRKRVPRLRLYGSDLVRSLSIVLAENLEDLLRKVDDGNGDFEKGFLHTSTSPDHKPSYYHHMWSRDVGRGIQELARYGFVEDAQSVVDYCLSHINYGDHWGRVVNVDLQEDYEVDGNTYLLLGIYRTWLASGRDKALGQRYVSACAPVFNWFERILNESPCELLPCLSELSGNPTVPYPVYAVFPTYGAMVSARAFGQMAGECGLAQEQTTFMALEQRLTKGLKKHLISGQSPELPKGATLVPEGVWVNGIDSRDGSYYDTAHFGLAVFPIHHWTRQMPFIQDADAELDAPDDEVVRTVNQNSYRYIRHEMCKNRLFRKYGFVSNTCWEGAGGRHDDTMAGYGQNYMTQAALLNDDVNAYSKCLEGIARLAYDGNVVEPLTAELSPWVIHECFAYENYEEGLDHTFGTYPDPSRDVADNAGDEGNLVQAAETLKSLALMMGMEVSQGKIRFAPRLPWEAEGMKVTDFPLPLPDGRVARIDFTVKQERWRRACSFEIRSSEVLHDVTVRLGPFPRVISLSEEDKTRWTVQQNADASWLNADGLSGNLIRGEVEV